MGCINFIMAFTSMDCAKAVGKGRFRSLYLRSHFTDVMKLQTLNPQRLPHAKFDLDLTTWVV